MNSTIESFYQEIGAEALEIAGPNVHGNLVVYAEVEDGVVSTEIYRGERDRIVYKFGSPRLGRLLYDFWCEWCAVPGNREWRAMLYRVEVDMFQIDFTYPENFDEAEDTLARRSRLAQRFFENRPFDYQHAQPLSVNQPK